MLIQTFYIYLICATVLFLLPQQKRPFFWLRLIAVNLIGYLCISSFWGLITNGQLRNLLTFTAALIFMMLFALLCYRVSWSEAVFCAVGGYSVQFIQSMLAEMLARTIPGCYMYHQQFRLGTALIILPLCYFLFCRRLKKGQNLPADRLVLLILLSSVVLIQIILCHTLRLSWRHTNDPMVVVSDCMLLLICSFCLLIIQFNLLHRRELEEEVKILRQLRNKEKQQFQISRDTIDLINRKCHDMRYQIRTIGESTHIDPQVVREMEGAIQIYDALAKTGNQALDVILAEKNLFCQKNGIHISYIADGRKLSFLREADIYSLFGNLLDNAIHAVLCLPPEQRIINLSVRAVGELLSINSYNRYIGTIEMKEGFPVTATTDTDNHGFGTRSMAKIVQKYGGNISFVTKDGIFNVNILFPSTRT